MSRLQSPKAPGELSSETLLEIMRGAYFAIDGIWFLAVEEKFGFDMAFEVDKDVWKKYGAVMARRIRKHLGLMKQDIPAIVETMKTLFLLEDWKIEAVEVSENEALLKVEFCPWYSYLKKAGREKAISKLCPEICLTLFNAWAKEINPNVTVRMPRPVPSCEIVLNLQR